jgi:flagellar hook-associated protein 3 FlgL
MSVSGVGTTSSLLVQSLADTRARLDDLQRQLGSGKKSDTYSGLGLDRGLTVGLRAQLSALTGYDDTIANVGVRLDLAQSALGGIATFAQTVKGAMRTPFAGFDASGQTTNQRTALAQLDQILGLLNTRADNRYLFSGRAVDQPAVDSTDHILNGEGTRAGFRQVLAERAQADLGANGLGRLNIPPAAGAVVSVAEDAVSPFGLKLTGVNSQLTNAVVNGPSGAPAALSIDLSGGNPGNGDTIKLALSLPDGTHADVTLTATTSTTPAAGEFAVGATTAATAANLQAALAAAVGKLARTALPAASAVAAANDFFTSNGNPPMRVAGPPFASAIAVVAGTSTNTVAWYTGESGIDPPRATAAARVDPSIAVAYGARADEQALRSAVANVAVFATMTFPPGDPDTQARYEALTQRLGAALDGPPGTQKVADIGADLAAAQVTMKAAQDRHRVTAGTLQDMLQQVEGVPQEQVAAQILALQTNLQASLQLTARMYQLSLVNFL